VARYVRRPRIARHQFTKIRDREVEFLTKDLKEKGVVTTHYLLEEFVDALAAHVPDRYRHAMCCFGLLTPRAQFLTSAALFALLGQKKRPRPQPLSWRNSLKKYFGTDWLADRH
jgi:Putative transposase